MIKISTEIVIPRPDRPSEGIVNFRVNCMACSYSFEQNKKNSNEILNLLEKVVIGSHSVDPESLCILTGRYVWQLVIDCIVIRDGGNMIDAVLNGVMAGLMDMRKPLVSVEGQNVTDGGFRWLWAKN
jgi:exosome complex component RRP45